jgi:tRNA (guanine-N7-)-methyltransferase
MIPINYKKYPFIAKIRHHISANNYLPLSELSIKPENYPEPYNSIEWSEKFLNSKSPNILDIGCGKGVFLISYALENPMDNILGIEIRTEAVEWINCVVDGEQVPNCRALHYTVANGLPFIENSSIDKVFYLFPDPWPKRRHLRRRAFGIPFLEEVYRVLKPGSSLYLATDVDYVHDFQKKVLNAFGKFNINELSDRADWKFPFTNKENFCIRKNIPIYRLICEKTIG